MVGFYPQEFPVQFPPPLSAIGNFLKMSRWLPNFVEKSAASMSPLRWTVSFAMWPSKYIGEEKSSCLTLLAESSTHIHRTDTGNMEEIILPVLATCAPHFPFRIYWTVAGRLELLNKPEKLERLLSVSVFSHVCFSSPVRFPVSYNDCSNIFITPLPSIRGGLSEMIREQWALSSPSGH